MVLQNNSADDLPVAVPPVAGSSDKYNTQDFSFATKLLDGATYQVSLKSAPVGQTCQVYKGASGTMPVAAGALKVGCEYDFDLVGRSTNDAVLDATYFGSSAPVIGGSDVAVGSTATAHGEGRFVVFSAYATGVGGTSSAYRQIFWRDRLSGKTLLVSAGAGGAEGNDNSFAPAISADGQTVAFDSLASNLVAGDGNGARDVFVWSASDPSAGARRVSVGPAGVEANGPSSEPTLSGDGKVVAFTTGASNLTPGVASGSGDNVVRRDLGAGTNLLISADATGAPLGGSSPALSEDGTRLAFYSVSSNLVGGDNNGLWDIFVHDMADSSIKRVSLTSTGAERNQGFDSTSSLKPPAISGNGRYVAFATEATNMVPGDTNAEQDVFVVDTQTGNVVRASVSSTGVQGNAASGREGRVALSYDGTWVAFPTVATNLGFDPGTTGIGNVMLHNIVTGDTRAATNQIRGAMSRVAMSRNAAYVTFGSGETLDGRFPSGGVFARFTGLARAWWWME